MSPPDNTDTNSNSGAATVAVVQQQPDSSCDRTLSPKHNTGTSGGSTGTVKTASATATTLEEGTPAIWNSWIETVGKRFPMADMSIRKVLDTLDRRPDMMNAVDD